MPYLPRPVRLRQPDRRLFLISNHVIVIFGISHYNVVL